MDLLYSRYSSPLELMRLYINQERFGEFVHGILKMDQQRKQEEVEKENEQRLWEVYLRSITDKSFNDWKKEMAEISGGAMSRPVLSMSDKQVADAKDRARGILQRFSPAD